MRAINGGIYLGSRLFVQLWDKIWKGETEKGELIGKNSEDKIWKEKGKRSEREDILD